MSSVRDGIDKIDKELIALIDSRLRLVDKIGAYKKAHNLVVYDRSREEEVIKNALDNWHSLGNKNEDDFILNLMNLILTEAKERQKKPKP